MYCTYYDLPTYTRGRILGRNPDKSQVLRVFFLVILALDFYFFKLTQPLPISVKEKGGKPDRKLYPLPYGLRNPYIYLKSENSQYYAQKPQ
jgi:hypothetical protein